MTTREKITEMLTTPTTGIGHYKPGWKQYQESGVEFDQDLIVDEYNYGTIPLATWMDKVFEYDEALNERVRSIIKAIEPDGYSDDLRNAADMLSDYANEIRVAECTTEYYTYNTDQVSLERDIQLYLMRLEFTNDDTRDGWYAVVMVHLGADARYGMSDAAIFKVKDSVVEHAMSFCGVIDTGIFLYATAFVDISAGEDGDIGRADLEWDEDKDRWIYTQTGKEAYFYNTIINGY